MLVDKTCDFLLAFCCSLHLVGLTVFEISLSPHIGEGKLNR